METSLPELRLYVVDDTQYCSEDFKARCGGKVFTAYFFNANSYTFCCEVTPSYEMWPLNTFPAKWPDDEETRDKLSEELRENDGDEVKYFHVRTTQVDKCKLLREVTQEEWDDFLEDAEGDTEKDRIDQATVKMMQHFTEYFSANPPCEVT